MHLFLNLKNNNSALNSCIHTVCNLRLLREVESFLLLFPFVAFHKAGRRTEAVKVLEQLTLNAVIENR